MLNLLEVRLEAFPNDPKSFRRFRLNKQIIDIRISVIKQLQLFKCSIILQTFGD